jgi:hypothetical protein
MAPGHRDALLHGLLDAADGLDAGQCRQLVGRALRSGIARVRRAALDRLCGLDEPGTALCHARSDAIGRCALGACPAHRVSPGRSCLFSCLRAGAGRPLLRCGTG